jgi:glycine oxidase
VVVVERDARLGTGATGGAAGLLLPESHVGVDPPWFVELFRTSLGLWRELEADWPGGVGLVETEWLGLAGDPAVTALEAGLPPHARRVSAEEVARLAPGLSQPRAGVLVSAQARVNPLRAAARLAAGLSCVLTGIEARAVSLEGGRIASVTTTAGTFSPGAVVFATGNPPRLEGLELDVPAEFVKGHMLATEPASARLPGSVSPVVTPIENSRLLVGGTVDPGDTSPQARPEVIARMWREAQAQVRDTAALRVSHQWCCFRPWHPDGLPALDRLPGLDNAWLTSGHYKTGILMAPITGQMLATWIASDQPPAEAARLSLARPSLAAARPHTP